MNGFNIKVYIDETFHDDNLTNSHNLHSSQFMLTGGGSSCLPEEEMMQIVGRLRNSKSKIHIVKTCFFFPIVTKSTLQRIPIMVIYLRPGIIWKAGSAVLTNVCFRENTHGIPTKGRMVV